MALRLCTTHNKIFCFPVKKRSTTKIFSRFEECRILLHGLRLRFAYLCTTLKLQIFTWLFETMLRLRDGLLIKHAFLVFFFDKCNRYIELSIVPCDIKTSVLHYRTQLSSFQLWNEPRDEF